jgi:hypothetical protein
VSSFRRAWPPSLARRSGAWHRVRAVAGWAGIVLVSCLVWFALVAPDRLDRLTVGAFLRIPIEGLAIVALALVLPTRARRIMAPVAGVLLGLVGIVKVLDVAFSATLDRSFNPLTDWSYLGPAVGLLGDSVGPSWKVAALIGAALLVVAVVVGVTVGVVRLARFAVSHRRSAARTVVALGIVWTLAAVLGLQVVAESPIASTSAAGLAYDQFEGVRSALHDQHQFSAQITSKDPFHDTAASDLLTGLRGKDVVVAFVESYGRVAVQDSAFSPAVDAVLDSGTTALNAAGFSSRSAFLTSPTFGGISWLAHSTFQSGLWVDSQQRYNQLVASGRFTLSDAFRRAGWRTVGDVPSNTAEWPQGKSFYHYDTVYDDRNLGYAGPKFSYANMPDQYILSAFQRMELAKQNRAPVMAEIDLVSSHTPWAPLPRMVGWNQVGDGSIYTGMPAQGQSPGQVWRDANQVRAAYGQSIQYSLQALISFVQTFHDDNLVLVVLGDHQPATIVSGSGSSHDVPISIIARDPKVMARISSWGWQTGLRPRPDAVVWPMSSFRDRFLGSFGGPSHT